jgi:hypothetical protein
MPMPTLGAGRSVSPSSERSCEEITLLSFPDLPFQELGIDYPDASTSPRVGLPSILRFEESPSFSTLDEIRNI